MKKLLIILILFSLSACSNTIPTPSVADIQTAIAETEIAAPTLTATDEPSTATSTPESTETTIPSPTSTPYVPIIGFVNVDYLNLRSGPGTLFEVLGTFVKNTELLILGKLEDSFWTKVSISQVGEEADVVGWMSGELLDVELSLVPAIDYPSEFVIIGQIELTSGEGLENINVSLIHRLNDVENRHVSTSNADGEFVAYYPEEIIGLFDVQVTSILCISSIMTENCVLEEYFKHANRVFIAIPQTEEINFYYEKSTTKLEGRVLNKFGNPVSEMLVAAVRDDGAESFGRSDNDGLFSISVGEGVWDVFALIVNPRSEGERIIVTITDQTPEQIEIISPE